VLLCTPAARLAGVPIALWYTHGTSNARLRLAVRLSRRVLTASLPEFPLKSPKVLGLGHGIDTQRLGPLALPPGPGRTVVSVGRISPVKDHALVVRGFAQLLARTGREDLRLRIVGGPPRPEHEATLNQLRALVVAEGLSDRVELVGAVPHRSISRELAAGHVFVSASRTGSLDKAVLEAMACARPVLVSNPAFRTELSDTRLSFREGDAHDLADKLEALISLSTCELEALGSTLARSVIERHDLAGFVARLQEALAGLT
jgi:glycosyltransferase involved in cell wall biosynthesis